MSDFCVPSVTLNLLPFETIFVCLSKQVAWHNTTHQLSKYAFSSNIAQFSKKDSLLHPFCCFVSENKNEVVNIPFRYIFHASISRTVTSCGLLSNI